MKTIECKVRETMDVTEDNLSNIVNEMIREGFELDGMHFAMRDNSKRPSMAFMIFYRSAEEDEVKKARDKAESKKPREE
jgi:hypothetical protein